MRITPIFPVVAVLHLSLLSASLSADDIPKVIIQAQMDGKDSKPFVVTKEQIALFLRQLGTKTHRSILENGKTLFRPNAILPKNHADLLWGNSRAA